MFIYKHNSTSLRVTLLLRCFPQHSGDHNLVKDFITEKKYL